MRRFHPSSIRASRGLIGLLLLACLLLLLVLEEVFYTDATMAKTTVAWGLGVENLRFCGHCSMGIRIGFFVFFEATVAWGVKCRVC